MSVPALQTAPQTEAEARQTILEQAATELGEDWHSLKWQATGTRAITIMRKGSRKSLMTISATCNAHLWDSWQTALHALQTARANGSKRVNHAEIPAGRL